MYRRISNDEGRRDFVRDVAITSGVPTQAVAVEIAVKESHATATLIGLSRTSPILRFPPALSPSLVLLWE